jgi:hypothetical protein|tara:strand:+ start:601 stop:813 length:213 start_codon:yes stop_codon:yes gene_type:complete
MKYVLVLKICSLLHLNCLPEIHDNFIFNSWSECASAGYLRAIKINNDMDNRMVDKNLIVINFQCVKIEES